MSPARPREALLTLAEHAPYNFGLAIIMELIWCFITVLLGEQRGKRGPELAQNQPRHRALYLPGSPRGVEAAPPPSHPLTSPAPVVHCHNTAAWRWLKPIPGAPDAAPQDRAGSV